MNLEMKPSARGRFAFDLHTEGAAVGWVRAGRAGLFGFGSHDDAVAAGRVAADVLIDWYARRWHDSLHPWPDDTPSIPIRGKDVVIGRILQADDEELRHRAAHGIEVCLPHDTWTALLLEVAQRTHSAIVARGIRIEPLYTPPDAA